MDSKNNYLRIGKIRDDISDILKINDHLDDESNNYATGFTLGPNKYHHYGIKK